MDDDTSRDGSRVGAQPGLAAGWTVLSYLISGPLLYGGLGWLLDRWLGTQVFVPVGIVAGMALSFYLIVLRYVRPQPAPSADLSGVGEATSPHHDIRHDQQAD